MASATILTRARRSRLDARSPGSDGRYEFHFESPELAAQARLIATAPGFGLGYPEKDYQIRLTAEDLPIAGRLVDLEGRPVAGVKVSLGQVMLPQRRRSGGRRTEKAGEPVTKMPAPSGSQRPAGQPRSRWTRRLCSTRTVSCRMAS